MFECYYIDQIFKKSGDAVLDQTLDYYKACLNEGKKPLINVLT